MAAPSKAAAAKRLKQLAQKTKLPWDPMHALFGSQRAVFMDKSRDRTCTGSRHGGKSTLSAVEMIEAGIQNPNSEVIYLDLTLDHADFAIGADFARLMDTYQIPGKLADDRLVFNNGSIAHTMSLSNITRPTQLQGHKNVSLVVMDECQDVAANLDNAINMLAPTLVRLQGRMLLLGIPGEAKIGPWWSICCGEQAAYYSQHTLNILDNEVIGPQRAQADIEKARQKLGEDNPLFIRHWLGLWTDKDDGRVYGRYRSDVNGIDTPPVDRRMLYVSGLDQGGEAENSDRAAIVVLGFIPGEGKIYHVDEWVSEPGGAGETGEQLGRLNDQYRFVKMFYDYGSAKGGRDYVFQADFHLHVDPVPFKDLDVEIPRANQMFQDQKVFVLRGSRLEKDLLLTRWNDKARALGKNKYSSVWKQDAADAFRAALLAADASPAPDRTRSSLTEAEQEALALQKLLVTSPKRQTLESAAEKIAGKGQSLGQAMGGVSNSRRPLKNPYGL